MLPADLQPGCRFRFGSFWRNADNPFVNMVNINLLFFKNLFTAIEFYFNSIANNIRDVSNVRIN
jgi:hypothetical protein